MTRPEKLVAHILVCAHKNCLKQGAREVAKELKQCLRENDLKRRVMLTAVDCLDQCGDGPLAVVYPDGVWYGDLKVEDARKIVEEHIMEGRIVRHRALCVMRNEDAV